MYQRTLDVKFKNYQQKKRKKKSKNKLKTNKQTKKKDKKLRQIILSLNGYKQEGSSNKNCKKNV